MMLCRPIDPKDFEHAMNNGWYSHLSEYNRAIHMHQSYPDLFVGCYNDDSLIGICYGWPEYVHRYDRMEMQLVIISMIPEYRRKGLGSILIKAWESHVRKRGNWLIGLGSSADMFYVENGYIPIEYCIKVHKSQLSGCDKNTLANASFVIHSEDPIIVLYFKTDGTYKRDVLEELRSKLNASSTCTIFNKQL
jgi:GNAT superfamily N-acetyltransferase